MTSSHSPSIHRPRPILERFLTCATKSPVSGAYLSASALRSPSVPTAPFSSVVGLLELRAAPDLPWDPHHPFALRIAGQDFTTRDIEHWRLV